MPTGGQGSEDSGKICFPHESLPILSLKKKKKNLSSYPSCALPNKRAQDRPGVLGQGWLKKPALPQEGVGGLPNVKGRQH